MRHATARLEIDGIASGNREIQENPADTAGTRFRPGRSGNPAGRPPGARNRATLLREAALAERAVGVMEDLLAKAEAGDRGAARLVLARLLPARLGPGIELPATTNIDDLTDAIDALAAATAAGEIGAGEANAIARLLQLQLRAFEVRIEADKVALARATVREQELRRVETYREYARAIAPRRPAPAPIPPSAAPSPAAPSLAAPPAAVRAATGAPVRPAACGRLVPMTEWLQLTGLAQNLPAALAKVRVASG